MADRRIGIIMHGVTGRMGMNQHLIRSVLAIRDQGGLALADGSRLVPDPLLVGRSPSKLEALADAHGLARWTLDLDTALADPHYELFFDAASTRLRAGLLQRAARSRLPRASRTRSRCGAPPRPPASGTAWSRTSSGCPGCSSSGC
jgi:predicted dehydrogenase